MGKHVAERRGIGHGEVLRGRDPAMPEDEGGSRKGGDGEERPHSRWLDSVIANCARPPTTIKASMIAITFPAMLFGQWAMMPLRSQGTGKGKIASSSRVRPPRLGRLHQSCTSSSAQLRP